MTPRDRQIWLMVAAILVTIMGGAAGVLWELRETTARHDGEHLGFRRDIEDLKQCRYSCQK